MDSTCSWSRIIGLDLSKATFKGCILSGEGFVNRKNFSGEMKRDESGYVLINNTIQAGDIVLMEAGSSTFNLARYLLKNSRADDVVVLAAAFANGDSYRLSANGAHGKFVFQLHNLQTLHGFADRYFLV